MQLLKYFLAAALFFSTQAYVAVIQRQASDVPACADQCLTITPLGGCAVSNTTCLCSNATLVSALETCIEDMCDQEDITTSLQIIQDSCTAVGISV
ncbi:hypothetical protein BT96DRAFT_916714, partial [Gymnopus androsaceus JB14]